MAKTPDQEARAKKARAALGWAVLAFVLGSLLVVVDGAMLPKVTNLVTTGIVPHIPAWIAAFPAAVVAAVILVIGNLVVVGLVVLVAMATTGDNLPKIAIVTFVLAIVLALAIGGSLVGNGTIPLSATPTPTPSATAPATAPAPAGAPSPTPSPLPALPGGAGPVGTPMP